MKVARTWPFAVVALVLSCRGILGINDGNSTSDGGADARGDDDSASRSDGGSSGGSDSGAKKDSSTSTDGATGPGNPTEWPNWALPPISPGAANYTVTSDTALDKTTGLMWARSFSAKMPYTGAATYCAGLNAGGFLDWRVPSGAELESIIDFTRSPSIEPSAFPSTPTDWFWTETFVPRGPLRLAVFFASGSVNGLDESGGSYYVRCVRTP